MKKITIFVTSLALMSACAVPTVDTSSEESLQRSMKSVQASLTDEKKVEFEEAYTYLAMSEAMSRMFDKGDIDSLDMVSNMNGLSAEQIIQKAAQIKKAEIESQLNSLVDDISSIETSLENAKKSKALSEELLSQIKITNPKYYWSNSGFLDAPILDFTIENGSEIPIKQLFAHGKLFTPGRSIPWEDADFNYEFAGGLEPGETERLKLDVQYSYSANWGNKELKDRKDLVLDVTILNFTGPDDEKVVSATVKDIESMKIELLEKIELKVKLETQLRSI